jgi:hypothetical protein
MFLKLLDRLFARLRRRNLESEVDAELAFHLEMQTQANIDRGMAPDQARRAARIAFGGVDQTKEAVRDARWTWFDSVWQDVRYASRSIRQAPTFAGAIILVLAIGVGGTTLVFSIVAALLMRPLPYADPDHLLVVTESTPLSSSWVGTTVPRWEIFDELRNARRLFDSVGAYTMRTANLSGSGEAERVVVGLVNNQFLDVAGVRPAIGRLFSAQDFRSGPANLAVLSDALWRGRFAASRDAIGRTVRLDDRLYTIIGVLPPDFRTVDELKTAVAASFNNSVALLLPMRDGWSWLDDSQATTDRSWRGLTVVARLRAGVPLDYARAEVRRIAGAVPVAGPVTLDYSVSPLPAVIGQGPVVVDC